MSGDERTMEDMTWWGYVKSVAPHDTNATIAEKVGVSPPSVSRWRGKNSADPATAAAFARSYGRPVLEAFVAAGFLTADEAGEQPTAPPSLATLSDDDLIEEVRRRMTGAHHGLAGQQQKTPEPPTGGVLRGLPSSKPEYDGGDPMQTAAYGGDAESEPEDD